MQPKISVIIINFNSGLRLARCIEHLKRQTFQDFEIIIVDNASSDDSLNSVTASNDLTIIRADKNLGFAAGNNLAVEKSKADWLAFLNPDAYAEANWLEEFFLATEQYPSVDAFGSTQLDATNPHKIDGAGDAYFAFGIPFRSHHGLPTTLLPPEGECFAACGAAAFYRRAVFNELGGFDERFFCYCEDVDLGYRHRLRGARTIQLRKAIVLHEGSAISGRNSDFTIYHGHRNRIWAHILNTPGFIFWAGLPVYLAINIYFIARLTISGNGRAYLRALYDAIKLLPIMWQERRTRQKNRIPSQWQIAQALCWSPIRFVQRRAKTKTLSR